MSQKIVRRARGFLTWFSLLVALAWVLLETGLARDLVGLGAAQTAAATLLVLIFGVRAALALWRDLSLLREPRNLVSLVTVAVLTPFWVRTAATAVVLHDLLELYYWLHQGHTRRILVDLGYRPARSLLLSFATLIGIGAMLLAFPASWRGEPVTLIDALFTATSAVCVTGLATVDTATVWSSFGHVVILVLMQLGGLGIMAIAAAMTQMLGRSLGLEGHAVVRGAFDEGNAEELQALLKALLYGTFAIEAIGAAILTLRFWEQMPLLEAVAFGVFHAVAAFCNSGFALFSDNLVGYVADPVVNLTIMLLIIVGGVGFGVWVAIYRSLRTRGRVLLPVHAKVVLTTSAILIWAGALVFFVFEYDRSLAALPLTDKVMAALFQSVTTRTAGFNTVPMGNLHPVVVLAFIVLMFIGASPGSTGGGTKTTTAGIGFLAMRAFLTERRDVEVFGRRLSPDTVMRALAIMGGYAFTYGMGLTLLLITETHEFSRLAFEVASALGTVGLTMDLTPTLSAGGKLIVALIMFVGRVGPLTSAAAAAARGSSASGIRLPEGRILVG